MPFRTRSAAAVLAVTLAVALAAPLAAQRPAAQRPAAQRAAPPGWPAFTRALDAWVDSTRVVGASALVLRDGRAVARYHRGYADRAARRPVDDRTLFHWASITKTLTAVAVMQLRDRGRLTLDDPITRWVPELREVHDPFGSPDGITLRMLLSHTAGFQNPTWPYGEGRPWEPFEPTSWEQLVAMMPYQELLFRPGARYSYSNPGFIYLARVVERITGDPWATYVQKNIFAPLGLTRSYFGATPYYLAADRSHRYAVRRDAAGRDTVVDEGADFDPGVTIPNSGWNAPLDDLARYVAFLTGAASDEATRRRHEMVLARRTIEEMWRPVARAPDYVPAGESQQVGLSFFLVRDRGVTLIGHTGEQGDFRAWMFFQPERRTAFLVAVNTTAEQPPPAEHALLGAVLRAGFRLIE